MAFRIGRNERVGEALRRVLLQDLEAATLLMGSTREALGARVHRVRRLLKRDRSLLRVFEPEAPALANELRIALRDAGRALAGLREPQALAAAAEDLGEELPDGGARAVLAAAAPRPASGDDGDGQRLAAAGGLIASAAGRVRALPAGGGGRLLNRSLSRAHGRARRGFRKAQKTRATSDLHEWRKRLKDLVHLIRLGGDRLEHGRGTLARAEEAEALLGDDRDLALLRERVVRLAVGGPSRLSGSVAIGRRRLKLRRRAFKLGRRIDESRPPKLSR